MSLEIYRSMPTADTLCELKMYAVNRELWPNALTVAKCQACLTPKQDGSGECCKNCFSLTLPDITDNHVQTCYGISDGTGNKNTIPAASHLLTKNIYISLCGYDATFTYGSCVNCGNTGSRGSITIQYDGVSLYIGWLGCAFGGPGGDGYYGIAYQANYTVVKGGCGNVKLKLTAQSSGAYSGHGSMSPDTTVNWPKTIELNGVPCT